MLTLYQGPRVWGLPNMSPFCIKVEAYLRLTGIEYKARGGNPRKAPKGKIPWVVDDDGTVIADSRFIIEHLRKRHGDPLDAELSAEQRALGHMATRMLEEGSYWVGLYARWGEPAGWERVKAVLRPMLPRVAAGPILSLIRRGVLRAGHGQGTMRHRADEIFALGRADIDALATILGDKPYLVGERPSSFDATVYAFAISLLWAPFDNPLRAHGRGLPNLEAYCRRFSQRYFPEVTPPP
jgi:glutathione S-transferase